MKTYYGDFLPGKVVRMGFNTIISTGVPTSLSSGAVTISKDGTDITPSGGVTLNTDVNSVTGYNSVVIDTSVDTVSFTSGSDYRVRLSGSSNVSGTSVVGSILGSFSILNRSTKLNTSGQIDVGTVLGNPPSTDATVASAVAAAVLASPSYPIATDASGRVTGSAALLDAVSIADASGVPSTFTQRMNQVWQRFFRKNVKSTTGNTIKGYAADNVTVLTTQAWTDDGAGNESITSGS